MNATRKAQQAKTDRAKANGVPDGTPGPAALNDAIANGLGKPATKAKPAARTTQRTTRSQAKPAKLTRAQARKMASDAAERNAEANKAPSQQIKPVKLTVLLVDGDFEVHKAGCQQTRAPRTGLPRWGNKFAWQGTDEREIVLGLWDGQIAESDYANDADKAYDVYSSAVLFQDCVSLPGAKTSKPKPKPASTKMTREQKTELATAVVRAAAEVLGDSVVMNGLSKDEAAKAVSHWLHHLPADRAAWPQILPKPDRSDWR